MANVNEDQKNSNEGLEEIPVPEALPQDNLPALNNDNTQIQTVMDAFSGRSIQVYSSIVGNDQATKIKIYNAMTDQEAALSDMLGKTLTITDMVAFPSEMVDDATGEIIHLMRVVLIDKDGKSYGSVAKGVISSLQKIMGVIGQAPWPAGIKMSPVQKKTRKGFFTLILRLEA